MYQYDFFQGRTILITGGGTGLGRSMALRFAEVGANLFLVGRCPGASGRNMRRHSRSRRPRRVRQRRRPRIFRAVESASPLAEKEFGFVDTLVNNAAGNFIARTEKLSPNAFNAVSASCSRGPFTLRWPSGKNGSPRKAGKHFEYRHHLCGHECGFGVRRPLGVRQSRRPGAHSFAGGRVGQHHIRLNAIAPGPFPTEGAWSRLMPCDGNSGASQKAPTPDEALRQARRTRESCRLFAERGSRLRKRRVRGDRWRPLAARRGRIQRLRRMPDAAWDTMEAARKK